jgi:uncharacterized protein with FMN-binding domain
VGILVVGWQFGAAATAQQTTTTATNTATTGTSSGTTTSGGTIASTSGTPASSGPTDGTYTGSSVGTRFGNVQVQVTVSGGSITDVAALQLTNSDGRSVQISNYAAPILRSEVLQSQSAHVNNVSGATYTSGAYLQSLQSALDQAGL